MDDEFVFFAQFVDTENRDDVLQFAITLQVDGKVHFEFFIFLLFFLKKSLNFLQFGFEVRLLFL